MGKCPEQHRIDVAIKRIVEFDFDEPWNATEVRRVLDDAMMLVTKIRKTSNTIDVGTVITDYSWAECSRPIVTIDDTRTKATVQIGDGQDVHPVVFELTGSSTEDLVSQLAGFGDIFAKAAEVSSR